MADQPPSEPSKSAFRITDFTPLEDREAIGEERSRRLSWTARAVVIFPTITFVGLLGRVYQLRAYPDPQIESLQQSQIGTALAAMRGGLIDRTGRVLAATPSVTDCSSIHCLSKIGQSSQRPSPMNWATTRSRST